MVNIGSFRHDWHVDHRRGNRDTLHRSCFSSGRRCPCSIGAGLYDHGHHCDAELETNRSSSLVRYDLLLVSDGSVRDCERSGSSPMGRRLPSVHSRSACFCVRIPGAQGAAQAPEQLGQAAYHRHGDVIYSAADRFLCGQRKELAALERASSERVLADTRCDWDTARGSRAVVAPGGADARAGRKAVAIAKSTRASDRASSEGSITNLEWILKKPCRPVALSWCRRHHRRLGRSLPAAPRTCLASRRAGFSPPDLSHLQRSSSLIILAKSTSDPSTVQSMYPMSEAPVG